MRDERPRGAAAADRAPAPSSATPSGARRAEFLPQDGFCPHCDGRSLRRLRARAADGSASETVDVVECRGCSFAWQYPLKRAPEDSVAFFDDAYRDGGRTHSTAYFDPAYKRRIAEIELDFVEELAPGRGRLLDVGAGAGIFATVAAERGWQVTALDPALNTGSSADPDGVRFVRAGLEELSGADDFDVVCMWDVIEHVTAPVAFIRAARERLRPGGWLVVETGNYKSADRVAGGLGGWIYCLDHRWYFAPDNLAELLRSTGFEEPVVADRVFRPGWLGSPAYAGPSLRSLAGRMLRRPGQTHRHLARHLALRKARHWPWAGLGIFTLAARKPPLGHRHGAGDGSAAGGA